MAIADPGAWALAADGSWTRRDGQVPGSGLQERLMMLARPAIIER
jgi:hypothetical protein